MDRATLTAILERARWAPSGDNSQPWTFRIAGDNLIHVLGIDHADTDVYDFDGRPTLLTLGFLVESMAIAASQYGLGVEWSYRSGGPHRHLIEVTLLPDHAVKPDALLPFLETRSVARGRYRSDRLTETQKDELERALGPDHALRWYETLPHKWQVTRVNAQATHIRLSIPEAFSVHQRILDWKREQSPDGVPSKAIGLDPMTLASMQWVMKEWKRADFMNRYAGGTAMPRLQMDLVPGLSCAAHFLVFQRKPVQGTPEPQQLITTGRALQRFWLTATKLGLVLQPSLAPLCFAYYAEHQREFTSDFEMRAQAQALLRSVNQLRTGAGSDDLLFMGRIGLPVSQKAGARSVRKPLEELWVTGEAE